MSRKLLPEQSHLQWSSSHNNHTFSEAPPTTISPSVKLLPQQSHLQWSSSHNNHTFNEAPPTTTTASVKLLPHLQWSSSHNNHTFSEDPPTTITPSVKLLPQQSHLQWSSSHCSSAINAGIFPSVYKWRRASEHQFEVKSAETEFIEGQREHERSRTLQNETHWRTNRLVFILDSLVMSLKNNNNINFKKFLICFSRKNCKSCT